MAASGKAFTAEKSIPDLSGKVILVTGSNSGLGYQTVLALASHNPAKIYVAARSVEKAAVAIDSIKKSVPAAPLALLECDLSSLDSVATAAKKFKSESGRLDLLFLNAGIMAVPAGQTSEGYEIQFGTNHVGHALLTKLLLPVLLYTVSLSNSDVRIVTLSSIGHKLAPTGGVPHADIKSPQKDVSTWARYGQSKIANIWYAAELARRYPSITSVSIHPGAVKTNLATQVSQTNFVIRTVITGLEQVMSKTADVGARNQLWAATARKDDVINGEYYTPVGVRGNASKDALNPRLAETLWNWTEKELEKFNP